MALDVLEDAEVDQRHSLGPRALDLVERPLPGLEVDLGRRRRRQHELARPDPHARRVARVERALAVEVADVMARVAGAREGREPERLVADDVDVLARHRRELAPEAVEVVAVQPPRAALEPARVDEVRRADLRDVHLQARVLAHEHARGAGMVEVDVGEQQVADVARARGPRSASRAFSSGTQVVGPQSCSARPSSVSSRYEPITRSWPRWRRSSGSGISSTRASAPARARRSRAACHASGTACPCSGARGGRCPRATRRR